jgi:hypothetical protein
VTFALEGTGSLDPGDGCLLGEGGAFSSKCTVTYTPTEIDGGTHKLLGTYNGSEDHGRATAQFQLNVTPVNDELESATRLTVPTAVNGTTEGATWNYEDDPDLCSDAYAPVWYSLKPAADGRLAVRLTVTGLVDSVVAVFSQDRTNMEDLGCEMTDQSGVAGVPFDAEAGKTYLVAVAAPWDARVGGFKLETASVPLVRFPGPRLVRDATTKLDPLLRPGAAFSVRLRQGVTYRFNASAGPACVETSLLAPGAKPSEDAAIARSGECSGYLVYTPGARATGTFPLVVRLAEGRATSVHVSVRAVRADDVAPGALLANGVPRRGRLSARSADVVDVYRFEAARRSDATLKLQSAALHADLLLLDDAGDQVASAAYGHKSATLTRRLEAGRYYAVVRARPGQSGTYAISLRLRGPTVTGLRLTRGEDEHGLAAVAPVTPAVHGGRVVFELERLDPLTGWHFVRATRRPVVDGRAELAVPAIAGRWRLRAGYNRTVVSSSSTSDWIEFGVRASTAPVTGRGKAQVCTAGKEAAFTVGAATVTCTVRLSEDGASAKTLTAAVEGLTARIDKIVTLKDPFRSELVDALDSAGYAVSRELFDEARESVAAFLAGLDAAPLRAQLTPSQLSDLRAAAAKVQAALGAA